VAPYVADEFFNDGTAVTHANTIDTSKVTNPAPMAAYQSERYGQNATSFTYTLPNLVAGNSYTVRLHFAEVYFTAAGQRLVNVSINGTQVLTNFDIFAAAGGMNIAIVEEFSATADSGGHITILFSPGSANNPKACGIEVISGTALTAPANLTAAAGNAQVSLSWTGSAGAASYNVKRSTTSGGPYSNVATGVTSTSFTNTGLTNGATYFYVVSAINSNGESPNSNQASATPTAGGTGNTHMRTWSMKGSPRQRASRISPRCAARRATARMSRIYGFAGPVQYN
jgi:Malectin domain/Fibronectin type III domain